MIFYLRIGAVVLSFFVSALITLVLSIFRWRHPSNGYIFTWLFTKSSKKFLGIEVQIKNEERLTATQPCIYIGNHQNTLDILIHACCFQKRSVAIGKKELFWVPFFGQLFYLTRSILLDRKNHERALKGLQEAQDCLTKWNISIYIFPEGTRNQGTQKLLPFKKGAFHMAIDAQVPVLPIVLEPTGNLIDYKHRRITRKVVRVEVLEPIPTKGMHVEQVDELAQLAYDKMQGAFEKLGKR